MRGYTGPVPVKDDNGQRVDYMSKRNGIPARCLNPSLKSNVDGMDRRNALEARDGSRREFNCLGKAKKKKKHLRNKQLWEFC